MNQTVVEISYRDRGFHTRHGAVHIERLKIKVEVILTVAL